MRVFGELLCMEMVIAVSQLSSAVVFFIPHLDMEYINEACTLPAAEYSPQLGRFHYFRSYDRPGSLVQTHDLEITS